MVSATAPGSPAAQFAEQGYVVLRGALPAELCSNIGAAIVAEYQRLCDAGWRFTSSGWLAGHLNLTLGPAGGEILAALEAAEVPRLIERICEEPMALGQVAGNLNLPGSSYQDFHIDGNFTERTMIANVCLVETIVGNGATALVPASHASAMSFWRFNSEHWARSEVRPALSPGDVLLRPSTLWHRGTPNRSAVPRPMAAFVWGAAQAVDPAAAESELSRPLTIYGNKYYGRWRRLKEFTAVRLPWLDHAVRLGRSGLFEHSPPR